MKVVCINNKKNIHSVGTDYIVENLILGKVYNAEIKQEHFYKIEGFGNYGFRKSRFISIQENRKQKLEKLKLHLKDE